jgi:hypothetical protein
MRLRRSGYELAVMKRDRVLGVDLVAHADQKISTNDGDVFVSWMEMGRHTVTVGHIEPHGEEIRLARIALKNGHFRAFRKDRRSRSPLHCRLCEGYLYWQ